MPQNPSSRCRAPSHVLKQYRMATAERMRRVIASEARMEQTQRPPARQRDEGLVDRITLPQAGRTRPWFPTPYGGPLWRRWAPTPSGP